jgi:hypothetical protein
MKIKIVKVKQVKGFELKSGWYKDMVVISTSEGYQFIDNLPNVKHSNKSKAWYGYDNWSDTIGTEVEITDDWGNAHNKLSTEASYDIWAKHPDVKMVR